MPVSLSSLLQNPWTEPLAAINGCSDLPKPLEKPKPVEKPTKFAGNQLREPTKLQKQKKKQKIKKNNHRKSKKKKNYIGEKKINRHTFSKVKISLQNVGEVK